MTQAPKIFDEKQRARQQSRARTKYAQYDFLHREMLERLADRVADTTRQFHNAALISPMPLPGVLEAHPQVQQLQHVAFDEQEALPLEPQSVELIVMAVGLTGMNDVPGALIQARRALKPDGLFLAMAFGGQTLAELRQVLGQAEAECTGGVSPRIAPAIDVRDAGDLLARAGFALPVVDAELQQVSYADMYALMRDIRGMGEGNALAQRRRQFTSRRVFERAAELYAQQFSDAEGRITATFELVTLTAWSPHQSQQKPARRGSGELSLKRFLQED